MTGTDLLPATAALCERAVASGEALGIYLHVRGDSNAAPEGLRNGAHEGAVLADRAWGECEPGVPATPDDVGELRCAAKPLTALCVARAVESGLLALDDTLDRWAPPGTPRRVCAISIRDLLAHRSQLPNHVAPRVYDVGFDDFVASTLAAPWPDGFWEAQPVYCIARSWHVLGWVLQEVYERPLPDIVRDLVTEPLGLSSIFLVSSGRVAKPYQRPMPGHAYAPMRDSDPEVFATRLNPAYGGGATLRDLGRLYAHLGRCARGAEGGLVRPETMRELTTDQGGMRVWHTDEPRPYGLGFYLSGGAASFGPEWDPHSFGHMGSVASRCVIAALTDVASGTTLALRLSSLGVANNDIFEAVGAAVRADLSLESAVRDRMAQS